jgi:hypothetical protein
LRLGSKSRKFFNRPLAGSEKGFKEVKRDPAVGHFLESRTGGSEVVVVQGLPKKTVGPTANRKISPLVEKARNFSSKEKTYYWKAKPQAGRGTLAERLHDISGMIILSQLAAYEPDDRALAILRGHKIVRHELLNAGGAYDLDQVRSLLNGITRQAVDKRVRDGTLLAVPGPKNRRRYPTVQFDLDGSLVEGLKETQAALPSQNAWVVLNFLVQENTTLDGEKPIDLLRSGQMIRVVAAARSMGEQGF